MKEDEKLLLKALQKRGRSQERLMEESTLTISERLNIPYKRARYICLKWSGKDIYDYGVSWRGGWLTEHGFSL